MPVVVRPEEFTLVFFDPAELQSLVAGLVAEVGLPADVDVTLEVDETTPLGNARISSVDPVVISVESGGLEDAKAPRQLDPVAATDVLGRLLFEVKDRLDPAFGDPPAIDELTLPQASAWQSYCVGRVGRLGHKVQRQRRLYHFRNRHGFTDAADAAFDRLWSGDGLTWADISALSEGAKAPISA
jgi:hypothetical protein